MKDIADELGVSVVTISKVLRNHSDISEETRQRVLARMKELNYQPNYTARALVTGRTMCVGLIVPDLVHPFFAEVAKALSGCLRSHGYGLLIASSEEDITIERDEIDQMLARRVDAIVVASAQLSPESFARIEERKGRYVLIDRQFAGLDANFVGANDQLIGQLATEHLIGVGCKRISHIRGPGLSTALGRLRGYKRALEQHKIKTAAQYIVTEETSDTHGHVSGYKAMQALLQTLPRPDGVFCYNDPSAMGAMKAILDAGLRVPDDIAVIGCGNTTYADSLLVPLSSIDQRSTEMGQEAGKLALSLIGAKTQPHPKTVLLEPTVVARASTLGHAKAVNK
jgi:LacI family transcriptional regulator